MNRFFHVGTEKSWTKKGRVFLNAAAFQVAWFVSVLGAAHGLPWLGPLSVMTLLASHLYQSPQRSVELTLALAAGIFGFLFDTALAAGGVFSPVRYWMPAPLSPLWMVFLWVNFMILLNTSLKWLHGRYILSALLGAVGGPAAYYGGAELGATQDALSTTGVLVLSVAWGCAVPALFYLAKVVNRMMQS